MRFPNTQNRLLNGLSLKSLEQFYELRSGDSLIGTLTFRSSFGTLAVAETADEKWTFKRVGFLNPRVTIRVDGNLQDMAIFQPKLWGGGVVHFTDRRTYTWKPANFWQTQWAFIDRQEKEVIIFRKGVKEEKLSDIFKTQVTVEINPSVLLGPAPTVLVPFGLYLMILQQQDAATTAAVS
ncbi:MAG: hypothetical protein IPG76_05245 [Acidobacteria bacterium]|nr:hypothetical protein [Acidobacteriota bacterium]